MPEGGKNMVLTDESLLRQDFPDGTKLTYDCSNGYEKESGSENITCIGGNWTELDLICKAYCPMPKGGENLVLTDESLLKKHFPDGTEVLYKCSDGFEKESGSDNMICIDGKWTEPDLICTKQSVVETINEGNTPPIDSVAIVALVCSIVGIFINICLVRTQ
ncbi:complement decay-accelerating factor-like [Poecilia reticulata]|uniref:complement decay-accelerating factor-like n=1 Tax=Poecilia reticulata TaxID=8081 RepID=UPI0004A3B331|nr:PREDICTED: complement decay-accelerating factor-like [Poecilia reticulata]